MNTVRVIPCLDVKEGRVVKGVNFVNLVDAGDPVQAAAAYEACGADEIVFLDITASSDERATKLDMVRRVAESISLPYTVGGGIRTVHDVRETLLAGADKVGINSAAIKNPELIKECSEKFGSQCIVVAIDGKRRYNAEGKLEGFDVYINGGRVNTGIDVVEWAVKVCSLGAGEILLTSMDKDGTEDGYDIEMTKAVADAVDIPVIASGGAGCKEHFAQVVKQAGADAVLAASLFHFKKLEISQLKEYLDSLDIPVRL